MGPHGWLARTAYGYRKGVELADQYVQNTEPVIAALHVGTRYIGCDDALQFAFLFYGLTKRSVTGDGERGMFTTDGHGRSAGPLIWSVGSPPDERAAGRLLRLEGHRGACVHLGGLRRH